MNIPRKTGLATKKVVILGACVVMIVAVGWRLGITADDSPGEKSPATATTPAAVDEWLYTSDGFEGTFVQFRDDHRRWSSEQWRSEMANLRRIGFDTLIIQWAVYDNDDYFTADDDASPVLRIAAAADKTGLDLYVGLALRKSWWDADNITLKYLQEQLTRNQQLASRMYPALKSHKSFRGWYIPHEITDVHTTDRQRVMVLAFYKELTGHLIKLDPLKLILASGYTDPGKSKLSQFRKLWNMFFEDSGIDIVIFQDGAGIARDTEWEHILPFVKALTALDKDFDGDVWLLAETFTQTGGPPIDSGHFEAKPADFDRLRRQLAQLGELNRKLMIYSYFDYMRPSAGDEAAKLYQAYRQHIDEKLAQDGEAEEFEWEYWETK